jgi:GNAT superfamily N-acetyltransferase
MSLTLRPFTADDYPALVRVNNAVEPDYPITAEEWRYEDEHQEPRCRWARWLAGWDAEVVGFGQYGQSPYRYHPRKFEITVSVHPGFQGRGIGSALYNHLLEALRPLDPVLLQAYTREDRPRAVRFLSDRGFQEVMREWESRLDVRTFDPAPFSDREEKVRAQGIEIRTLRELETDPDRNRKLYALMCELERDVPSPDAPTDPDYSSWIAHTLNNPNLLPDGWFIAVHHGQYLGYTNLWRSQAGDYLDTGLTGVKREYRRRGIALALKLRAAAYARQCGAAEIRTGNEVGNVGMLAINQRLGFVRQPAWIQFENQLQA